MKLSLRAVPGIPLPLMAFGVLVCAGCAPMGAHRDGSAELRLHLGPGRVKVVSVALGQNALKVIKMCRPARAYADDDPWVRYPAAEGGAYVLFFSQRNPGPVLDPRHGKLYAVAHYTARDRGVFLLPKAWRGSICGDHITLKVAIAPDETKVATVALGMSARDVMQIFEPLLDHVEGDASILYNSVEGGKYLLAFSPQNDSHPHDSQTDRLCEVMCRAGGQKETHFLLPRGKRGQPLPAAYVELLGGGESHPSPHKVDALDARTSHQSPPRPDKTE